MSAGVHALRVLALLASHAPGVALRATDTLAALAWPRIRTDDLRGLFPDLAPNDARRAAAHARNSELRNLVVERMPHGSTIRPLVETNEQLAALEPPMILGTFHLGALTALGPALERVPGRVLVLRRGTPRKRFESSLDVESADGDEQRRALVFHRALEWLTGGNSVFMPLDPEEAVRLPAPFCGRVLQLARGPFALARIGRVPLVPIVARWRRTRVEIVLGDAIVGDDESALAAAASAWLERYLRERPEEISRRILALTT